MTTFAAVTNSEIAVGAPITNNLKTKERDNLLAIQENDPTAPTIAYATTAGTITNQGALATKDTVSQAEIDASAVGQGELKTATAEASNSAVGVGTRTVDVEVESDYILGAAVRTNNAARVSSNTIEPIVTASTSVSTSYVGGAAFRGTWVMTDSATRYIRIRYVSASPPYIGEDGLMYLFVYCKYIDGTLTQVHVCDDPPWRQPEYKKIKGKKILVNENREMVDADKFMYMNEKPHPFGVLAAGESVVMLDPTSKIMKQLQKTHRAGESVGELIHEKNIIIGNKVARYAPNGLDVVSIKRVKA